MSPVESLAMVRPTSLTQLWLTDMRAEAQPAGLDETLLGAELNNSWSCALARPREARRRTKSDGGDILRAKAPSMQATLLSYGSCKSRPREMYIWCTTDWEFEGQHRSKRSAALSQRPCTRIVSSWC